MVIPKDSTKRNMARTLRKEMTPQERHLWYDFLRYYPVKIYKQRIIGRYIVDFYCASARLVIEIDGSQHYEKQGQRYDAERTTYLESRGLAVVRYSNADINVRFRGVCEEIDQRIKERSRYPSPSARSGCHLSHRERLEGESGSPFGSAVCEAD